MIKFDNCKDISQLGDQIYLLLYIAKGGSLAQGLCKHIF